MGEHSRPHLDSLTSLRGLAALWVLTHNDFVFREHLHFTRHTGIIDRGYLAVDFFFVLSGFVLSYVYCEALRTLCWKSYANFMALRFARIYPLYLTLLGIRIVVEAAKALNSSDANFLGPEPFTNGNSIVALAANILMVQAWGCYNEPTWIPTFWSVSAEWFAYLVFPLLLYTQTRVRMSPMVVATACFLALSLGSLMLNQGTLEFPLQFSLLRCLPEFVIGMMLASLFSDFIATSNSRMASVSSAANLSVPALFLAGIFFVHYKLPDVLFLAAVCVLLLLIPLTSGRLKKVIEFKPLIYLGEISYAIYLSHMLVQSFWRVFDPQLGLMPAGATPILDYVLKLLTTLFLSSLLYRYIENPARRSLRRFAQRVV